jgi:hypothetical protein
MSKGKVVYYRADERSEDGEIVYVLRYYSNKAKHVSSRIVKSPHLLDELEMLRKNGYLVSRVEA